MQGPPQLLHASAQLLDETDQHIVAIVRCLLVTVRDLISQAAAHREPKRSRGPDTLRHAAPRWRMRTMSRAFGDSDGTGRLSRLKVWTVFSPAVRRQG